MRFDTKLALIAFALVLLAMVVASFIGWDRWSDLQP